MHYARWRHHGTTELLIAKPDPICVVDYCNGNHYAKGYCRKHYGRFIGSGNLDKHKLCLHCGLPITNRVRNAELHPECVEPRARHAHLKRKFDLSLWQYEALLQSQQNACAICQSQSDTLHVDHDHLSGAVRGLLCGHCNRGIGLFRDSTERLERAIEYLRLPPYFSLTLSDIRWMDSTFRGGRDATQPN